MKQVIYLGPRLHDIGVSYGMVFMNGKVHPSLRAVIKQCPAFGTLVVPVQKAGFVQRQLDFDYGHVMRGTAGEHVACYREAQKWLADRAKKQQQTKAKENAQSRSI